MAMQNADHKISYASSPSAPPHPPESSSLLKRNHILLSWLSIPLEVRMFRHGGKDVVAGRPGSIGVPEVEIHPLPIPIISHLTDNELVIFDTAECLYGPTQDVGLSPLHVKVQETEGIHLAQEKVEAGHGENRWIHLDIILLLRILSVFSSFLPFVFWRIQVIVRFR